MPTRASRALVAVLATVLLAVPATSEPPEARFDPRPALFLDQPVLRGDVVAECGRTSPLQNSCGVHFGHQDCALGCAPNVLGGVAYTGTLTALVWGKGRQGDDRHISWACAYVAGTQARVLGAGAGHCSGSTTAEWLCLPDCGYYLWPPFRLEGRASSYQGAGPAGSWTVRVES